MNHYFGCSFCIEAAHQQQPKEDGRKIITQLSLLWWWSLIITWNWHGANTVDTLWYILCERCRFFLLSFFLSWNSVVLLPQMHLFFTLCCAYSHNLNERVRIFSFLHIFIFGSICLGPSAICICYHTFFMPELVFFSFLLKYMYANRMNDRARNCTYAQMLKYSLRLW